MRTAAAVGWLLIGELALWVLALASQRSWATEGRAGGADAHCRCCWLASHRRAGAVGAGSCFAAELGHGGQSRRCRCALPLLLAGFSVGVLALWGLALALR